MFKHREESTVRVRRRLIQHIKSSDQAAGLSAAPLDTPQTMTEAPRRPRTDPGLIEVATEALCISTSTEDLPVFWAIANKNKARFSELCQAASGNKAPGASEQSSTSQERIERFWTLANDTLPRVWKMVTNTIEMSATAQMLFKPFQYGTRTELQKGLENIHRGISNTAGWTTSLEDAIRNAIPNHGVKGRMSFVQRRLQRHGYTKAATTTIGVVAVIKTAATYIGNLSPGKADDRWIVPENTPQTWKIHWAERREHKIEVLRDLLPPAPSLHLPNLLDSDLHVVVITNGTPIRSPGRECDHAPAPPSLPSTAAEPDRTTPWSELADAEDDVFIDYTLRSLPPLLPSSPKAPHAKHPQAQNSDTSPIRVVLDGHSFWQMKPKGKRVQKWVLQRADSRNHKVCVALEWNGKRIFTSFPDAPTFWKYYASFKGRRCFYWINRSFELPTETSLLYFDVEWYSATTSDDPTTGERLRILKNAVNACLPKPCSFQTENLCRPCPKGGKHWYNSWHLYTDVTLEHNAKGCMKPFVRDKIWKRIMALPLMWCPIMEKPILDLKVYTKNRQFRIPGSLKGTEKKKPNPRLPHRDFFISSRMCDRPWPPTYLTHELGISTRHRTIRGRDSNEELLNAPEVHENG